LHRITIDVIPRSPCDRGNLLPGSNASHYPINIEYLGYSVLIGAVSKCSAVPEIAMGINAPCNNSGGRWLPAPNEQSDKQKFEFYFIILPSGLLFFKENLSVHKLGS